MSIPLLEYQPRSQNQRVAGYEIGNEDTPRRYRLQDCSADSDFQALVWASYRQIFSEHETLRSHRQITLETQLKNRSITVQDFIRGLAKSDVYRRLVVETNSNYRVVELSLKRLLGRSPYNQAETIAWSIVVATKGLDGFVDALVNSEEYRENFGEDIVPFQRRRYKDRPFNLVTPRYGEYWRDKLESERYKWGDVSNFLEMARTLDPQPATFKEVTTANIEIPSTTREQEVERIPVSINPVAGIPLR